MVGTVITSGPLNVNDCRHQYFQVVLSSVSIIIFKYPVNWASLVAQTVRRLPTMRETGETQVQSLGWEDPLEKEMATHSSILAWKILWVEEPGGPQSMGSQRVGHN